MQVKPQRDGKLDNLNLRYKLTRQTNWSTLQADKLRKLTFRQRLNTNRQIGSKENGLSFRLKCQLLQKVDIYFQCHFILAKSKQSHNMFLRKHGTSLSNTKTGSSFTYTFIFINIHVSVRPSKYITEQIQGKQGRDLQ